MRELNYTVSTPLNDPPCDVLCHIIVLLFHYVSIQVWTKLAMVNFFLSFFFFEVVVEPGLLVASCCINWWLKIKGIA